MPFPDREFRYQFLPVWRLQTSLTTALIFAATFGLALLTGRPIQRPDILLGLSVSGVGAVFWALVIATVRFQVTHDGLRTFNTLGQWRFIPWQAVSLAQPGRYYFLPHLRLTVDNARLSFWVPLFLADMAAYRLAVIERAGSDNPVARALPVPASIAERHPLKTG